MTNPNRTIRISTLDEQGKETDLEHTTPEERFEMVWQLTVDAWAFMGVDISEQRLQRHIVRVTQLPPPKK